MRQPSILPTERSEGAAAARLFCFAHAGGSAAVYYQWRRAFPDWLEVMPFHLPRRELRSHQEPFASVDQLVKIAAEALASRTNLPYALLGTSMGAVVAFELVRELRRRAERLPTLIIAASSPPPHRNAPQPWLHELPDDELLAKVQARYNGVPDEIASDPQLLKLMLPALRADLKLIETRVHRDEPALDVDILALSGTNDPHVGAAELHDWRQHTTRRFAARQLPGGHFFLFESVKGAKPLPAFGLIIDRVRRAIELPVTNTSSSS